MLASRTNEDSTSKHPLLATCKSANLDCVAVENSNTNLLDIDFCTLDHYYKSSPFPSIHLLRNLSLYWLPEHCTLQLPPPPAFTAIQSRISMAAAVPTIGAVNRAPVCVFPAIWRLHSVHIYFIKNFYSLMIYYLGSSLRVVTHTHTHIYICI